MTRAHPIPDEALQSDIAILGKKGRGKSYTARGLVERLLAMGLRVVVLDPLSTWWGLAAGRHGFPIAVLGGPHGDLPLAEGDGAALGRHLATADQSVVLDLGHMRKAEMIRFVTPLLEELYTHNREPLWLVLEEADVFAPQNPGADTARLYGEVDRIARRGRGFGFRLITLTQRPARLAKDVLTQLSTLVALGITSPQDREAIKGWVEGNADRDRARAVVDTLASLKVGEGWVWAPDLDILDRVTFPKNRTPDTSATPKAGEARPDATRRKTPDVAALKAALAVVEAPAQPDRKTGPICPPASDAALAEADAAGYARGVRDASAWVGPRLQAFADAAHGLARAIDDEIAIVTQRWADGPGETAPIAPTTERAPARPAGTGVQPVKSKVASAGKTEVAGLNSAGRKMLAVLDTDPPVRRSWRQVATLAGLKARGGHFNAGKKALVDQGLVVEDGGLVAIRAPSAGARPEAIDGAALVELWAGNLSGAAPRILRHLFTIGVSDRATIADSLQLQPRGGHWNAAWKELRDNGLIVESDGWIHLSDLLGGPKP